MVPETNARIFFYMHPLLKWLRIRPLKRPLNTVMINEHSSINIISFGGLVEKGYILNWGVFVFLYYRGYLSWAKCWNSDFNVRSFHQFSIVCKTSLKSVETRQQAQENGFKTSPSLQTLPNLNQRLNRCPSFLCQTVHYDVRGCTLLFDFENVPPKSLTTLVFVNDY